MFTDTESCSLLTSITICFAASLLKLDTGSFFIFISRRLKTPSPDRSVVKTLSAFTSVTKNIFCLLLPRPQGVCWTAVNLFQKSPFLTSTTACLWNFHLIFRMSDFKARKKTTGFFVYSKSLFSSGSSPDGVPQSKTSPVGELVVLNAPSHTAQCSFHVPRRTI